MTALESPLYRFGGLLNSLVYGLRALAASYLLLGLLRFAYTYIRPFSLSRYLHWPDNSWALVTGVSDGIVRALAQELCSRGFNVILRGRSLSKSGAPKKKLNRDFPSRSVRIIVLNASTASPPQIDEALGSVADLHITVLINNVGGTADVTSPPFRQFTALTPLEIKGLMHTNNIFAIHLTRALLPILRQNSPALIMNIGSFSAIGMAYLSIYSATKGFLASMTSAIATEFKAEGLDIEVLHMKVAAVRSAGNKTDVSFFVPESRVFAKSCLDRVGCGSSEVVPY